MNDDGVSSPYQPFSARRRLGGTLLALSVLVVAVGTIVPASAIGWLRSEVPTFALLWDWLDATLPLFNPLHVMLYAWIAILWRMLAPQWPRWRIPLALAAFGVVTEAMQCFAPGRTPRVSDVLNDVLGIAIGLALVAAIDRAKRSG